MAKKQSSRVSKAVARATSTKKASSDIAPPGSDHSDARAKILRVATQLFAEKGLDGTSTRDIASASGLNISLISYYFGGKVGLYRTIIFEHAMQVKAGLDKVASDFIGKEVTADVIRDEISSLIRHFVDMRLSSDHLAMIFMAEKSQKMPHAKEVFENLLQTTAEKLVAILVEAQKKGIVKSYFPARAFFLVMVESIFGYFMSQECEMSIWKDTYKLPEQKDEFIDFLTDIFTKGILS